MAKTNEQRLKEIYDAAVEQFLDKNDFNVLEYLDDEDTAEYVALCKKVHGECIMCGETKGCKC